MLTLSTGLKKAQLFSLKWQDVDLKIKKRKDPKTKKMRISYGYLSTGQHAAKNDLTRTIPLNCEAHSILKGWKRQQFNNKGLVFPKRDGVKINDVKQAWREVLYDASIGDFRWHDLRHSFASKLVHKKVDLYKIQELLGHSSISMTEKYAHVHPQDLHDAVATLTA